MRNSAEYGTTLLGGFASALSQVGGATEQRLHMSTTRDTDFDAQLTWVLPGDALRLDVEIKQASLTSRNEVRRVVERTKSGTPVLLAAFLSPAARDELRQAGWSYWDETGNMLIQNRDPFVWVERTGASRNPSPDSTEGPRRLRSLKGQAASVVLVKLLTEGRAATVRELSRETGVGVATVSRVIELLRDEEFLNDTARGPIVVSDIKRLARRWAQDYSFTKTFKARRYFSLLGEEITLERLRTGELPYAVTGVQAANQYLGAQGRIASLPSRGAWIYTPDREAAERALKLAADPKGSILVGECDFLEQEGIRVLNGLRVVWPWRTVGDLLSTQGRTAAVGEELADALERERI
ncbi:hypothetical protein [Specibacter cremeus]|uniref:hypothetical protein n=1 Tax=Specibacter cremeus TaxID=1629051 RepID=UPI000F7740AE|nr:hypothetical protein [Specibacter cremeus]